MDPPSYAYNGDKSYWYTPANPPANALYQFTSDGAGSGQWSVFNGFNTADSNFTRLRRVGGSVSTCGPQVCYAVGGWRNDRTENGLPWLPASGIVSYNLSSHTWYNDTLVGTVFAGPYYEGSVFYTDIAGRDGILVVVGGFVTDAAGFNPVALALNYIYIYDLATKTWYRQETTGDVPQQTYSCMVGTRGHNSANKTYEIFLHGGSSSGSSNLAFDDVWVLSIPSFNWHRAGNNPVRARSYHRCQVAGQRQMVLFGGLNPDYTGSDGSMPPDIWPHGLAVFDLTDMVFKSSFNTNAGVYTSPQVVQKWNSDNGAIAQNVADGVKSLFFPANSTGNATTASSGPSTPSTKPNSAVGAIAGGVVGGIVGIIIIAILAWYISRRKTRQHGHKSIETEKMHGKYEVGDHRKYETDGRQTYEAEGRQTYEAGSQPRHELPAHEQRLLYTN